MKTKVLITGGSGTVGRELISILLKDSTFQITCFDLKTPKNVRFYQSLASQIQIVYGDIRQYDDVEKAVLHQHFVIHLAAIIPPLADQHPVLAHQVNVLGTGNIIKAIEKSVERPFLIYSSSVSVYGDRVQNPYISVQDSLCPSDRDEYGKTKVEVEKMIRHSNIDWTIFRLTAIMGYRNHKMGSIMFHMPLDTPIELCTPKDTALALRNALDHAPSLKGNIYNLSGGERCRIDYRSFLERSFQCYGLGKFNFPDEAFATRNFHCGYFTDGDQLEEILHFRRDTIESYFSNLERSIPWYERWGARLFSPIIKKVLLCSSEPLRALRKHNNCEMQHFFGKSLNQLF